MKGKKQGYNIEVEEKERVNRNNTKKQEKKKGRKENKIKSK